MLLRRVATQLILKLLYELTRQTAGLQCPLGYNIRAAIHQEVRQVETPEALRSIGCAWLPNTRSSFFAQQN